MFKNTTNTLTRTASVLTAGASMIALFFVASPLSAAQHDRAYGAASNRPTAHANATPSQTRPSSGRPNYGTQQASHTQTVQSTSRYSQGFGNRPQNSHNVPTDVNNGSFAGNGWRNHGGAPATFTNVTKTTTYVDRGSHDRRPEHSFSFTRDRFIPEERFHSRFGRSHEFRIDREVVYGGHRRFQFGGASFVFNRPWPSNWLATDAVYVDYIGGAYMLCNRRIPGVYVPVNVETCDSCGMAAVEPPPCDSCNQAPVVPVSTVQCNECNSGVPTLARGQSIAEVVSILGTPDRALNLGFKQIYLYPNMKVVFINGRMIEAI